MTTHPHTRPRRCALVFARAPVLGTVKTRLAARLGPKRVLGLYRCFVEDTLDTLDACDTDVVVHFDPPDAGDTMRRWLGDARRYAPQRGDDLGARMRNAFIDAFAAGYRQVLCLGTDIPQIRPGIVADAFASILAGASPLGPAADGGYYLIGFPAGRMPPGVFDDDIAWGTPAVFEVTASRVLAAGIAVSTLPTLRDIDTAADLAAFLASGDNGAARRTRAFMAAHGQAGGHVTGNND